MASDVTDAVDDGAATSARGSDWLERPRLDLKPIGTSYSRFVGMMKVVLPVIAGVLVLLVVVWPQLHEEPKEFRLGPSKITIEEVGGQKLINARYTGTDANDQPFTVTAEALTQGVAKNDLVRLENPKADVSLSSGSWLALTAPGGTYSKDDQSLDLIGGVNLFHDEGYNFVTESASLNFAAGTVFGADPVAGQGPLGQIESQGFRVLGNGARILFTGKARLVLYPDKKKKGRR